VFAQSKRRQTVTDTSTTTPTPGETPIADSSALLWEEAQRQIVRQEADLDGLRNRATALLTVASVVAALFGGHVALVTSRYPGWTRITIGAALVFFAASVALVIAVLASRDGWRFSENLSSYFGDIQNGTLVPSAVTFNLAKDTVDSQTANQTKLSHLHKLFKWGCIFAGLQVVAWGVAVII
jgi:hypothetical protein